MADKTTGVGRHARPRGDQGGDRADREELGDTVAAVTEKADVKKQAKRKASGAK